MSLGAQRKTRLLGILSRTAALLTVSVILGGQAYAINPTFEVTGGDVATGGWFDDHSQAGSKLPCQLTGKYQAPDWVNNNNYSAGGLYSFAFPGATRKGSNSAYAAYSTGLIEYVSANAYGFFTSNPPSNSLLSFASYYATSPTGLTPAFNNLGSGGLIEGAPPANDWHCVPDYYSDYRNPSTATDLAGTNCINTLSSVLNGSAGAQYIDVPSSAGNVGCAGVANTVKITGASLAAGWNHTLFVRGNVYISSNITYAAHDLTNIPHFALVVVGNIWVDPAVTQLDGIYVAQPDPQADITTAKTGQFWSCNNSSGSWDETNLNNFGINCETNKLTVNGSVIAAKVYLTRMKNGIAPFNASWNETLPRAETFNYTPETAIGGSFGSGTGSQSLQIDSLISLPPVY